MLHYSTQHKHKASKYTSKELYVQVPGNTFFFFFGNTDMSYRIYVVKRGVFLSSRARSSGGELFSKKGFKRTVEKGLFVTIRRSAFFSPKKKKVR